MYIKDDIYDIENGRRLATQVILCGFVFIGVVDYYIVRFDAVSVGKLMTFSVPGRLK